jgi:ABC-type transport system involved in cytochrome c biogenesis permease subunit
MLAAEELLQAGTALRFATIGSYAGAFAGYVGSLAAVKKARMATAATVLAVLGVTAHTAYLVSRWIAAGEIEIAARVNTGDVLSSADRFWYLISHPPYTNLFDALNFTGWALMLAWLLVQKRWGLHVVGALAAAVALIAMGEASLVSEQSIEPLVPALQSYWILIHVAMLFVSYALFTLGAAASLLYLVRAGTKTTVLGAAQAGIASLLLFVSGGSALITRAAEEMSPGWTQLVPSRLRPGKFLASVLAVHQIVGDKRVKLLVEVPGVGPFLLAAALVLAAGPIVYIVVRVRDGV